MKKKLNLQISDEELMNTILVVFSEILDTLRKAQAADSRYYDSAESKGC
ncbi:hypothetical protein QFZ37_002302 [Chryseobacterium ginsenosidimutans]|nr:hypothetical protein [Chryseobacterium ginsenosidimutans]MDQ0593933.1 hypothetical protein [Chryseobacterium ginsenosidimutans]